jgi:hypothetical protein
MATYIYIYCIYAVKFGLIGVRADCQHVPDRALFLLGWVGIHVEVLRVGVIFGVMCTLQRRVES